MAEGQADLCMSMGRLEHFSERELAGVFGQMRRILAPGGVGSHIIDHRDHYWHYDKSIHCFHHLTFSDERWEKMERGRKRYRNRLLEPDYVRLFEQAGFEVVGCVHELHKEDAKDVDPTTLWGRYSDLSRDDLKAAVSHLIVRRP
jgi:cyclopropane fatty-acyl-phospholipid synthase-like methyltransferase